MSMLCSALDDVLMIESPNKLDAQVGARIRRRRVRLGLTQSELAAALGVSYQQVQKYERGENRIGAGALRRAAEALRVSISYFYDDAAAPGPASEPIATSLSPLERDLLTNFRDIGDEAVRNSIAHLVAALASASRNSA